MSGMAEPGVGDLQKFCAEVQQLRLECGNPSVDDFLEMIRHRLRTVREKDPKTAAKLADVRGRTQVYAMLAGTIRRPPSLTLVEEWVLYCVKHAREKGYVPVTRTNLTYWRERHTYIVGVTDRTGKPAPRPRKPADSQPPPSPRDEASSWLADSGIYVWTPEEIQAGLSTEAAGSDGPDPVEAGAPVDVFELRAGRLANLRKGNRPLGDAFAHWLDSPTPLRGGPFLRIFWLIGTPGHYRSRGLLWCLIRAGEGGLRVLDAGADLGITSEAVGHVLREPVGTPSVLALDLNAGTLHQWAPFHHALIQARKHAKWTDTALPRLVVAGTADQAQAAADTLSGLADLSTVDGRGRPHRRPNSYLGMASIRSKSLSDEDAFNRGLPRTSTKLFGRARELRAIDAAWTSDHIRVMSIVAYGGTGKSAMINRWLTDVQHDDYRGAGKVLAWSFYSQGTKENLVSADPFVSFALSWFGDEETRSPNPWAKGERLAELIKKHHCLLILDGIEPLQYPLSTADLGGGFTDDSIKALLGSLAKPDWEGLCLITSRVPLTDIAHLEQGERPAVVRLDLSNLDDAAAVDLLRQCSGSEASFRELQHVVHEVDGHALAVTLLGNYLRDVHDGDLAGLSDLERLTVDAREGGHARRVMASYVQWLARGERTVELGVLHLIGLFDRPAPAEAMQAVTESFRVLPLVGSPQWNDAVEALRRMGLLSSEIPEQAGTLDAHPLVREHFRDRYRAQAPTAWADANEQLYGYYQSVAPGMPTDAEGMQLLYASVAHGCAAGLHTRVLHDVLLPRVWRDRRTNYSTRILGMTGSDLAALSHFFEERWVTLVESGLSSRDRVLVLTNTGVRLRQLGRLRDARRCFHAVADETDADAATPEEYQDASYAAAQNCELQVIAGQLVGPANDAAIDSGRRAVALADAGFDAYFSMHARTSLAEVHMMLAQLAEAEDLFDQAARIPGPEPPFLYSQSLYRYGYHLIEAGRAAELLRLEGSDKGFGRNGDDSSLLSAGIRLTVLGAAHRSIAEGGRRDDPAVRAALDAADRLLGEAVTALRTAGYSDYIVRGLMERAHFFRVRSRPGDLAQAQEDLASAAFILRRGEMDLLAADIALQQAACLVATYSLMTLPEREEISSVVSETLGEATRLVTTLSYRRRRPMLDTIRATWAQLTGAST